MQKDEFIHLAKKYTQNKCSWGEKRVVEEFFKILQDNGHLIPYNCTEKKRDFLLKRINSKIDSPKNRLMHLYSKTLKMIFYKLILLCLVFSGTACKSNIKINKEEKTSIVSFSKIEVQGHRGERGYFPENSLPGFISAVNKGIDVLELDVVISRDKKVVVSHEPYMSCLYMLTSSGYSIPKESEQSYNFYKMTYDSIKKFDAGSKGNRLFPDQKKISTYKPLLSEVIDSVENYIIAHNLQPVRYNIELKSVPSLYGIYQPQPEEFVALVMELIQKKGIENKINLQSFDPVILNVLRKNYPEIVVAYLVSGEGIQKNLSLLDFTPEIYSPHYALIKNELFVDSIKALDMRLIPWTVNKKEAIKEMIQLKVDGIISDYPERVLEELNFP